MPVIVHLVERENGEDKPHPLRLEFHNLMVAEAFMRGFNSGSHSNKNPLAWRIYAKIQTEKGKET